MTLYPAFYKDFPRRCLSLLDTYCESALTGDREVTLMISIASSGFVIPFEEMERRRKIGQNTHLLSEYLKIYDNSFVERFSNVSNGNDNFFWRVAETVDKDTFTLEGINDWVGMGEKYKISLILPILSHALAHGRIHIKGNENYINEIIFISQPGEDQNVIENEDNNYCAVIVSPHAFLYFLRQWFDLFPELDFNIQYFISFDDSIPDNNDLSDRMIRKIIQERLGFKIPQFETIKKWRSELLMTPGKSLKNRIDDHLRYWIGRKI